MQDSTKAFLSNVLEKVGFREAHREIELEIHSHIEDLKEAGRSYGLSAEESESSALRRMGDPRDLGLKLNKIHRPRIDWLLIGVSAGLLSIGLLSGSLGDFLSMQLIWTALGLIACFGFSFIGLQKLRRASFPIYVGTLAILTASFFSVRWYAGQPYLHLGGFNVKVVDLSSVLFVLSFAGLMGDMRLKTISARSIALLLTPLLPLGAYLSIGSIYPAFLLLVGTVTIILATRLPLVFASLYALTGGLMFSILKGNQFLEATQVSEAILSERHTDFIFRTLRSESPLFGTLAAICASLLIVTLLSRTREMKSLYGQTLMGAIASVFSVGILWTTLSSLGFMPMPASGVNFPLLSYGGSMLVAHMSLIGVAINLYRRKNIHLLE